MNTPTPDEQARWADERARALRPLGDTLLAAIMEHGIDEVRQRFADMTSDRQESCSRCGGISYLTDERLCAHCADAQAIIENLRAQTLLMAELVKYARRDHLRARAFATSMAMEPPE